MNLKKFIYFVFSIFLIIFAGIYFTTVVKAAPPVNFQTTQVIGSGLEGPSGFEFSPDGRIFILQRTGEVRVYKNGVLLEEPFAVLPTMASGDRGMIGIAFDPDFLSNHYVYFYYTDIDLLNKLVRFNASGDVGTDGPVVLYQTTSPSDWLHVGGSVRFGPDGKLYFAVGDNGYPPNGQMLNNPHGKILRINKDGTIPTDNPFYGQANVLPEIWAYGFRNPWRFQFDSQTGRLFGGDVGDFSWEEMNRIIKGGNYGWPVEEGMCDGTCGYINPIYTYNHFDESAAITGGPVYRGGMFPGDYFGSLFFGDYAQGFIKRLTLDSLGNSTGVFDFDLNAGSVVDLKVANDGSLYYITYYPGRLYRISYSTDNHIPVANATSNKSKGVEPLVVQFSSGGSYDPDGDTLTYQWDFGDGTISTLPNPSKTYTLKGTYTVQLYVSDGQNSGQAIPLVIQVGTPPNLTIVSPTEGAIYKAGDAINYSAAATDGAGFDIDDGDIITEIFLHHGTHIHPLSGSLQGRTGQFTIPATGEASADTWHEFKITATDTNGLSSTKSVNIFPKKSNITLVTEPAGLKINLDGVPTDAPYTVAGIVNFERELNVTSPQTFDGVSYKFDYWSDGGSRKHTISTAETDTTYTAFFEVVPSFLGEYFNNQTLTGVPALTRNDAFINFEWNDASPHPLLDIDKFSVRWSKAEEFIGGTYKFTTSSDDGVRLYIDNELVIDKWVDQGTTVYEYTTTLTSGEHLIRMEYYENTGGAIAKLDWIQTSVAQSGFQAQYFNNQTLSGAASLNREDLAIDFVWDALSPAPGISADHFSARWTKVINIESGVYEFEVLGDDGVRFYVDGEQILDKWIDQQTTTYKVNKSLTAGNHTVVLEYYENLGGAVVKMTYSKISDVDPVEDEDYTAQFWNTPGTGEFPPMPTGTPDLVRVDNTINFEWDLFSPDPVLSNDNFVGIWQKNHLFEGGNYKFTTLSDDGIRVFIDDNLIFDSWNDHAMPFNFHSTITPGIHNIRVEYYENDGGASLKFDFEKVTTIPPFYKVDFYSNPTLTGTPVKTRFDEVLYFVWAENTPDPAVPVDNFSARWVKTDNFGAGNYHFTVFADDGMRLFIDDQLIIDAWTNSSEIIHDLIVPLTSGNHTLKVEYRELTGGAYAKMYYKQLDGEDPTPTPQPALGFNAKYWNLPTGAAMPPTIPATLPDLTRVDSEINFTWNEASPDPLINLDKFVVEWSKTHTFEAGNYHFETKSDDGVRLYVDGELLINQWNDHGVTTFSADKVMTAGDHIIKLEYYENDGGAIVSLDFAKTTTSTPTFTGQYFNNKTLTGSPTLTRDDMDIFFVWDGGSPDPTIQADNFSVRWTKTQTFIAGAHSFTLKADDGIRFWIDDVLVVDDWTDHIMTTYTPTVNLTAGTHTLKIEYYDNNGGAVAIFQQN